MAKARSQIRPWTVWTVAFHVLLILGALTVFREAWEVISWILIALFIALALDPAVRFAQRAVPKRGVAVLLVYLVGLGGLAALFVTLVPMVADQAQNLAKAAPDMVGRLRGTHAFQMLNERFHIEGAAADFLRDLSMAPFLAIAGKIAQGLAAGITISVLSIFMLLFGGDLFKRALFWFEPHQRDRYRLLARRMQRRVGGYVSGTLLVAAIGGVVMATTLAILGNPYFLPLGLLMIVLGVIPWLGSALGAVLLVSTTFAAQGTKPALILLGIYLVYQQVEGHLLQPLVQRHTIRMNPLLIAMVMLLGTALYGLLGALLALPVAGAVQVVLMDVQRRRQLKWRARRKREAGERGAHDPRQLSLWTDRDAVRH